MVYPKEHPVRSTTQWKIRELRENLNDMSLFIFGHSLDTEIQKHLKQSTEKVQRAYAEGDTDVELAMLRVVEYAAEHDQLDSKLYFDMLNKANIIANR